MATSSTVGIQVLLPRQSCECALLERRRACASGPTHQGQPDGCGKQEMEARAVSYPSEIITSGNLVEGAMNHNLMISYARFIEAFTDPKTWLIAFYAGLG